MDIDIAKISGISRDEVLVALELILSEEDFRGIKIEDLNLGKRKVFMGKVISIPHTKEYIKSLDESLPGGILSGEGDRRYLNYTSFHKPMSLDYTLKNCNCLVDLYPEKRIKAATLVRYLNAHNEGKQ